MKITWCWIDY